ncbi:protein FANTASTIC FOUR 3 [Nicotiana sylvestris]|uniref:Protein FANTASTIC FOUR 3-like n=1 Tax=Nicotiana sylvestris TaxID=4096 RepID=A0A1U7X434_NICSY|nr:PREDICTED: protein FANTASTIC FOUR 3-like [Nicotiana sylvestris]
MSTIVYQGTLQSCFESQIIETTTLKLKVPTPSTIEFGRGPFLIENNAENLKEKCQNKPSSTTTTTSNLDLGGGWSSIQTLSNISKEEGSIYVHPLSKRSSYSSRLSAKSLELCTESLGSETGSCDIMDSSIFSSSFSYSTIENSPSSTAKVDHKNMAAESSSSSSSTWSRNCNNKSRSKKKNSCTKFPPPLTTIRGSNSLQFRPHREDGRLIIKAVESPLTHNYLQAERSNGRLRLCFYKDGISNFEENEVTENDMFEKEEEMEEEKLEEEEEKEEESDVYNNVKWDIDGNNFEVEGEMGMEKCQSWLSRCKEGGQGNKVFCDWRKPLWVATS